MNRKLLWINPKGIATLFAGVVMLESGMLARAGDPPGKDGNIKAFFEDLKAGKSKTIVLYGTSLTEGGMWTIAMRRWFDENYPRQVKVINSGGSGQHSGWGVEKLQDKVLAHHPDMVFVEFSYNDAHEKFRLTPDQAAANLDTIIEGIRRENPGAILVLQIMNPGWDAPNGNRSGSVRSKLETFNDNYRRAAKTRSLVLIDHFPEWERLAKDDPDRFQAYIPDGSHPTAEGSRSVTWAAILRWLEEHRESGGKAPL